MKNLIVYATPNQPTTFAFEVTDGYGTRTNSSTIPSIVQVYNPNMDKLSNFPQSMSHLDTGLYEFTLITNSVGTFIVDIVWTNPDNMIVNQTFYQVISRMPASRSGGYVMEPQ